jgi:uncharacterized protein YjdB
MKNFVRLSLICFTFLYSSIELYATNYYVNDGSTVGDIYCSAIGNVNNNGLSPASPKLSLKSLLSEVNLTSSDVIYIDAGTYVSSERDINLNVAGITIMGAGTNYTIFDNGGTADHYLFNINANNITLSGFKTIRYASQTSGHGQTLGVAPGIIGIKINNVQVSQTSTTSEGNDFPIVIKSGAIVDFVGGGVTCNNWLAGGGIKVVGGTVNLTNYVFSGNEGAYINGSALYVTAGTVKVYNSLFTKNYTTNSQTGSAIFVSGGTVEVYDSKFDQNICDLSNDEVGGTIKIIDGTFKIYRSIISNHIKDGSSGSKGAGIGVYGHDGNKNPIVVIEKCHFFGNNGLTTFGTDVYLDQGTMTITDCLFESNTKQVGLKYGTLTISNSGNLSIYNANVGGNLNVINTQSSTYTANPTVPIFTGSCIASSTSTGGGGTGLVISCPTNLTYTSTSFCKEGVATPTFSPSGGTFYSTSGLAINSNTGVIDLASSNAGTYEITYNHDGCPSKFNLTISTPSLQPIIGSNDVCVNASIQLSNATSGGNWTSSNTQIATVNPITGEVRGVSAGNVVISYSLNGNGVCSQLVSTKSIAVLASPVTPTISGGNTVEIGSTISFTTSSSNGVWTSSNNEIATINSSGELLGKNLGKTIISLAVTSNNNCSSSVSKEIEVVDNGKPECIGILTTQSLVCLGSTPTFTSTISGGVWSSSNSNVASIDPVTGMLTTISSGTTIITYSKNDNLNCINTKGSKLITISPIISSQITGESTLNKGATTLLSVNQTGGIWSSSLSNVASINSSGLVSGINAGKTDIKYTNQGVDGCFSTTIKTINVNDNCIGNISDINVVCLGSTPTFTSSNPGGKWSSSNLNVGIIDVNCGLFTALGSGITNINYTIESTGNCPKSTYTKSITISNYNVGNIIGKSSINQNENTQLEVTNSNGIWASNNPTVATVNNSGLVSGVSKGIASITYSYEGVAGCTAIITKNIGVFETTSQECTGILNDITSICNGSTPQFISTKSGGTWTTTDQKIGTINPVSGVFTALSTGVTNVVYTIQSTNCLDATFTKPVIVTNVLSAEITGLSNVKKGATTKLSASVPNGTWESLNNSIATVNSDGTVTGINAGKTSIKYYYTSSGGCLSYSIVDIIVSDPCTGVLNTISEICNGSTPTFTSTIAGGTWVSSNTNVATIDNLTGVLKAISPGTSDISYTVNGAGACANSVAIKTITVYNTEVGTLSEDWNVDVNKSITISSNIPSGVWTITTPSIALITSQVNNTATIRGLKTGSTNLTYTYENVSGCTGVLSKTIFVNNSIDKICAGEINDLSSACNQSTLQLSSTIEGGTWTSSNTSVAVVDKNSGYLKTLNSGYTLITYTVNNINCKNISVSKWIKVSSIGLSPIDGPDVVKIGNVINLSTNLIGGIWSTNNQQIATVNSGTVTGVNTGQAVIDYKITGDDGCKGRVEKLISVDNEDSPCAGNISNISKVCSGSEITFTSTVQGGKWYSSNTNVGTINSLTGKFTTISPGTTQISYVLSDVECPENSSNTVVKSLTVSNIEASQINGSSMLNIGEFIQLTTNQITGQWFSSNSNVATIDATGRLEGISLGKTNIEYNYIETDGCLANVHKEITVNKGVSGDPDDNPCAKIISTVSTLCKGSTFILQSNNEGGIWSSSDPSKLTIDEITGYVKAIEIGTVQLSYTLPSSICDDPALQVATKTITITNGNQATLSGLTTIEKGEQIKWSTSQQNGNWSSSNQTIVSVDNQGNILGIGAGEAFISYTVTNNSGCTLSTSKGIIVNDVERNACVGEINIPTNKLCKGSSMLITSSKLNGIWASSNQTVGTIDETSGLFVANSEGMTEITYSVICDNQLFNIKKTVIVGPTKTILLNDNLSLKVHQTSTLVPSVSNGTWNSYTPSIASVGNDGIVTGNVIGSTFLTYSILYDECTSSKVVIVNVSNDDSPCAGTISNIENICLGSTPTFTSSEEGGVWTVSKPELAIIDPVTGYFRGLFPGSLVVTYSKMCNSILEKTSKNITITDGLDLSFELEKDLIYVGQSVTITPSQVGGNWVLSNSGNVSTTINSSTNSITITGLNPGVENITYKLEGNQSCKGEIKTDIFIQSAATECLGTLPTITKVCKGSIPTFSSTISGGIWSSSNTMVGSINEITGVFTPNNTGVTTVSYYIEGCEQNTALMPIFVVDPNLVYITPTKKVKVNGQTSIYTTVHGGTWTSSNPNVVTVDSKGKLTGVSVGYSTITYTLSGICSIVKTCKVYVYNVPNCSFDILGNGNVCSSDKSVYSISPVIPGVWSSSKPLVASINSSTGVLQPLIAGSTIVKFTPTGECINTTPKTITVSVTTPSNTGTISGPSTLLHGSVGNYTSSLSGGSWSSSDLDIANFISEGDLKAFNDGKTTLKYTVPGTICNNVITKLVTVYGNCSGLLSTNSSVLCEGENTLISSTIQGGVWTSDNPSIAKVNSGTGLVSAINSGSTVIRYKKSGSCLSEATKTITVKPSQTAGVLVGASSVEISKSITLYPFLSGGVWSSSNTDVAIVDNNGTVTALSLGVATINYVIKESGFCDKISSKTINVIENNNSCSGVSPITYEVISSTPTSKLVKFDSPTSSFIPISGVSMIFETNGNSQSFLVGESITHTYGLNNYNVYQTVTLTNGSVCNLAATLTFSNSCVGVSAVDYIISSSTSDKTLVSFNSTVSPRPFSSIEYSFGDGSENVINTNNNNVSHTYENGVYTVTKTVTLLDKTICTSSKQITLSNSCGILSSIQYTTLPSGTKTLVSFTNPSLSNSSILISSIDFDFGDGNSDEFLPGSNIEYIYGIGNFTVNRTVFLSNKTECKASLQLSFSDICSSISTISSSLTDAATSTYTFTAPSSPTTGIMSIVYSFGDGETIENLTPSISTLHSYAHNGEYNVLQTVYLSNGYSCKSSQTIKVVTSSGDGDASGADDCNSFNPIQGKRYWVSAWVKEEHVTPVKNYDNSKLIVKFSGSNVSYSFYTSGEIIDGWQRVVGDFIVPIGADKIVLDLSNSSEVTQYFDDIRIHPFNASMKSYVYDPVTLLLSAELDDNNYATFYEYDKEGQLIRIKKETERGIMTIQESRSSNPKKIKSLYE